MQILTPAMRCSVLTVLVLAAGISLTLAWSDAQDMRDAVKQWNGLSDVEVEQLFELARTTDDLAQVVNEYGAKGRLVYVEGRVTLDRYETKEGEPRAEIKVKAYEVLFLDRRSNNDEPSEPESVDDLDF